MILTRKIIEEEFEIKIRNQKEKNSVNVLGERKFISCGKLENFESSSQKYEKENSNTIHFKVAPKAEGEEVIKYRVKYTW